MCSEKELTDWLKSLPREQSEEEVAQHEFEHDLERGTYIPPGEAVHHGWQEARH